MWCDCKNHQIIQFICTDSKCIKERLACIQCKMLNHKDHQQKCQDINGFLQDALNANEQKISSSYEAQEIKENREVLQKLLSELISGYQDNCYKPLFRYILNEFKELIEWDSEKQLSNTQDSTQGSSNQNTQNKNQEIIVTSEIVSDWESLKEIQRMAGLSQRDEIKEIKEEKIKNDELVTSVYCSIRLSKQISLNDETNQGEQQPLSLNVKGEIYKESNYLEGDKLFCKQKYLEAVIKFSEAIRVNKQNDMAWLHKIMSLNFLNDSENCLKAISEAKTLFPESIDIYYIHGVITEQKQNYKEALELYKFYIQKNQQYVDVYYRAGNCEFFLFQKDSQRGIQQAINYLQQAINLSKYYLKAHFLLGIIYQRIDQFQKAQLCFEYIIDKIDKNDFSSYYQLANCLKNLKLYKKALEANNQFLILQPQDYDGLIQKGQILFLNKQHCEAINLLFELKNKYPHQSNIIDAIFKNLKIEQQK